MSDKKPKAATKTRKAKAPHAKAPPSKAPPAKAPEAAEAAPPIAPEFTNIDVIRAHLGESSVEECTVLIDVSREKLADSGRRFATTRATDDAVRIYGGALTFFQTASAEVIELVKISDVVLRAGAWAASQAGKAFALKQTATSEKRTNEKVLAAKVDVAKSAARPVRDKLEDVLINVAGSDSGLITRIADAMSPVASGKADTTPGGSIASLVTLAKQMLASTDPAVVARRAAYKLTPEYVADCAAAAAKAVSVTKQAEAPRSPAELALTTIDVEVWDGLALAFMEKVVTAFSLAADEDTRVPRLRFVSLKSLVGRTSKPAKTGKKPPTDPTK